MLRGKSGVLWLIGWLAVAACGAKRERPAQPEQHRDAQVSQPSQDAGAAHVAAPSCSGNPDPSILGIASAPLDATPPLALSETVQLLGEGLALTLAPQQNVAGGLRWRGDRMFVTADAGFWDISPQGSARFYPTSSLILWGLRAGDLDGDGDLDLIVLTLEPNSMPTPSTGGTPSPFLSRLSAWERTPEGLTRRGDVMSTQEMRFAMPYALGDADGDKDLDVVGFQQGAPIAYIHDGKFGFSAEPLGAASPELMQTGTLMLDYADRNGDGHADLLVIIGSLSTNQLSNDVRVLLADETGKLGAPGPAAQGEAPLVPHGPDGIGLGIADVTGDGIADVLQQDPQSSDAAPIIRLFVSIDATTMAPPVELRGLGFEFADIDRDGKLDIVSSLNSRLIVLLSRGDGAFESRDLGVSALWPDVADYVVDPGSAAAPAVLHTLYKLRACPACGDACSDRCVFDTCQGCLSDADCKTGRCERQACKQ